MLTVISGNNRNGYPCALNKVDDIFQRGIPPFETEGLPDLGEASQKGGFPLAGLRGQMLGSVKVTASEESKTYAGVTVSMTSEESKTYGKCDSGSHLSSPKSGSAKYRQHLSSMQEVSVTSRNTINGLVGVCADNLLNIKPESAFVQTTGKEKGPRPALQVMQLITCEESNELHHNSYLQATGSAECKPPSQPLGSMPRDCNLSRASCFNQFARLTPSRSASDSICSFRDGDIRILNCGDWPPPLGFLSLVVDKWPPIQLVSSLIGGHFKQVRPIIITPPSGADYTKRGLTKPLVGVTVMAEHQHTQTRPKFTDTYWIVPCYSTTPYGKVSFTRQDRRTFIALFKDSRLIWAGRQPVQGMVKITPPSTITEIVTVQGVAHV